MALKGRLTRSRIPGADEMPKSLASFGGHGVVVLLPEDSEAHSRARSTMEKGATLFSPELELCTTWPPHVTIAAGPWLDEAAARQCAEHVARQIAPFNVTLGPRVEVEEDEGEHRAAAYSADQTLRAGWVEATTPQALTADGTDQCTNEFMRLHGVAMTFLNKELHKFEPHSSLHYFASGECSAAQKAVMYDSLKATWETPVSFLAPGLHVTQYLGRTPDEWKAIAFFPFQAKEPVLE